MRGAEMARTDPAWVHELVRALKLIGIDGHERLPVAAALSEVRAVAEGAAAGRAPGSQRDVRSLREDTQASLEAIGPGLRRRLEPCSAQLRREVGGLAGLLKDPRSATLPALT